MQLSTIRPGLLIALKTAVRGNVSYDKRDIEPARLTADGSQRAKWETERTILDLAEYQAATKVRSKARSTIGGVCAKSAFGLLCPEARADDLDSALVEARRLADDFNVVAQVTRVNVYVIVGRIAADDVEAVRSINGEIRDLLADMAEGVSKLDVKSIRDAASRARDLGQMLSPDAQTCIKDAIAAARGAAKQIVKAGEQAAQEVDERVIRRIVEARTAFLDLDPAAEIATPIEPSRALDLEFAT